MALEIVTGAAVPQAGDTVTVGIRPEGFTDSGEWTIPARLR